ncbi:MAG: ROK family protein [Bacteroidales bacterium]|jgi:glucokinase|nr:ROK family protein [Bacteroidales bacterium]
MRLAKYSIGVDIGGTNTAIGLVNSEGEVVSFETFSTPRKEDPTPANDYVSKIVETIKLLLERHSVSPEGLTGIGIGAPNANYYSGCMEYAVNFNPTWGKVPLKEWIEQQTGYRVVVTNDANAAAYGEMIFGGAKGMRDFIMITLGTGVGSGIVVNGKLVYGHDGFAGEVGHVIIHPGGRVCGCGRKGCLEQYCSANGIKQTYMELMDAEGKPYDKQLLETEGSRVVSREAEAGDSIARETYRIVGNTLGLALANAVVYTSPEAIFLMGGPLKAGNLLLNPIIEAFERENLFVFNHRETGKPKARILKSKLNDNASAILGAAALTYEG